MPKQADHLVHRGWSWYDMLDGRDWRWFEVWSSRFSELRTSDRAFPARLAMYA